MKICWRVPVLMLFFAYAATFGAGERAWDSTFDNTLFNVPKGWSKVEKDGSVRMTPIGLDAGDQVAIVITPGGVLKADFPTAFKDYRGLLRGKFQYRESQTQSTKADEGYAVLYAAEVLENPTENQYQWRCYLGSNPGGNRIEMVMLVASSEALYNRFTPAFEEFAKTLSYKNAKAGASPTSAPSTQPDSK
ncbi:MAG TPA: hypothetical protein VHS31_03150 [Tepidisphaeraceae bacterium]|nr:hypothetical protein [Tepidisphaeraceae bacterium]